MPYRPMPPDAGIAIGAILFVIALLAILGMVIAAGSGDFGTAAITDRIAADIASQANLIRSKINECNLLYGTNSNYDGYPSSNPATGTAVSALNCTGDPATMQALWTGERPTVLPPSTAGFGAWSYINTNATGLGGTAAGGRCIWITPNVSSPNNNAALVSGLTKAANKFRNATTFVATNEVIYDPASASQKFVLWITEPTSGTPNSNCLP